ncbi:MAG TPA: cytochrome P450 [Solirubrobacterales bacterium]|nr:cytochrome P450 [Solirubrobacterales bacterium]
MGFDVDDLTAPAVIADPYTYFGQLRESDPVHWNESHRKWIVTRHEDVAWLVRQHDLFSSQISGLAEILNASPPIDGADRALAEHLAETNKSIVITDRPDHKAMRQAIQGWFTPRAVEKWRAVLSEKARALIDAKLPDGRMEVKADLAVWLPLTTVCLMLDVPTADAPRLRELSDILTNEGFSPDRLRDVVPAWDELRSYFSPLLESRAKRPGEDLISLLAEGERAGAFDRTSSLANVVLLLVAGHGTTLNLICNGVHAFIRFPDQWERLREDPGGLAASAVEECLRYDPSLKGMLRVTARDTELRGRRIRAGDSVFWMIAAANRDPRVFTDPDSFDIARAPNPHLTFGAGIHHCLGAALARVEAQETFRALAAAFPRLRLAEPVTYRPNLYDREVSALHVAWD